jgi:hypothetical protein
MQCSSFHFQTDLGELSTLDRINFDSYTNSKEREKAPLTELPERPLEFTAPKHLSWWGNRENCLGLSGNFV